MKTSNNELTEEVANNIARSLAVVQFIAKAMGVAPMKLRLKTKKFGFLVKNVDILRTVPLLIFYMMLIYYSQSRIYSTQDMSFIRKIVMMIYVILTFLIVIFAVLNGLRDPLNIFFKELVESDVVLRRNHIGLSRSYYRQIYWQSVYMHAYMFIMVALRNILLSQVFRLSIVGQIGSFGGRFAQAYSKYCFAIMITQVRQRFDKLNSSIRAMCTSKDILGVAYLGKKLYTILIFIGCGNKTRTQQEVCNLFNAKYPDNPITRVSKIESKFRETGDVKDLPKAGRPKIAQDKNIDIVLSMEVNPQSSSTLVASENEVSQTTVLHILRKENYRPFKFQLVQELNEDDPDRRLQFCETMMNLCQTNPNLHQQILFSGEAKFCLNGTVNRQNCRHWSRTTPHWIIEAHTQHLQKLNVWTGIVANRIIGPSFFEETLTGERYLEFLQNDLKNLYAGLHIAKKLMDGISNT
ncbi:hypothetical protein NQ318_005459 [Aromia moschata]|uniref:Gustatory receptor n=1 Tax=Aromia moschata TaxID=1265417 RepID=A0AAV8YWL0_9CUCU|nr:hypothetical protein NQ318_005459 [Aromia moschata]